MNRRLITIVSSGVLVLAIAIGVYWFGSAPAPRPDPEGPGPRPDPSVNNTPGKTPPAEAAWLDRLASSDPSVRQKAIEQIDQHKSQAAKAIPVLMRKLSEKDPALRTLLSDTLARLGKDDGPAGEIGAGAVRRELVAALENADTAGKTVAALTLGKIRLRNDAAIPGLHKAIKGSDKTLQYVAALALRQVAPRGEVPLPEGLDENTFAGKWLRFAHQGNLTPEDVLIVPPLIEALQDTDPAPRQWAAEFFEDLGDMVRTSPEAIPALTQVFKGKNDEAARAAARALGKLSWREASLTGVLLAALGDGDAGQRRRAAEALDRARVEGASGKAFVPPSLQTPEAVAALAKAVADTDSEVRLRVLRVLGRIGAPAAKAIPAIVPVASASEKVERALRLEAIRALGAIAVEPGTVVPLLLTALKDKDPEVRKAASVALASYGKEAVAGLRKVVAEGDPDSREGATAALGAIGPEAREAIAELTPLLKSEMPRERVLAADAIARIDAGNKDILPVLKAALGEKEARVRQAALEAIQHLGPAAASLTPDLGKALEDTDKDVAWHAADALGAIGPAAVDAVPALAAAIKKCPDTKRNQAQLDLASDEYVTWRSIEAVRAIGPGAKEAVPALLAVLAKVKDIDAADTLSLIDPSRTEGLPALIEGAKSPFDNLREASLRALGRLGPRAREAIPALLERLPTETSTTSPLREALVRLGPVSVPALIQALEEKEQRLAALDVLGRIGPAAKEAAPAMLKAADGEFAPLGLLALAGLGEAATPSLLEALKDSSRRLPALHALARVEGASPAVVKALTDLLADKGFAEKAEVLRTLAALGPAAKSALPVAKEQLTGTSEEIQAAAALALIKISGDGKVGGPVLVRLLTESKIAGVRRDAALGLAVAPAKDALPALQMMLKDPAVDLREAAADAIGALGKDGAGAVPALVEAVGSGEMSVQLAACRALGKLGPSAKEAVPVLLQLLQAQDESSLQGAELVPALARALWKIEGKESARELLVVLRRQLTAPTYPRALAETIETIGDLGAAARDLVPAVAARLDSPYQSVRWAAARALGNIGPAAKSALPWLERSSTQEPDEELRRRAKAAIAAIQKG
jgi:HEAT repeat protein